MLRPDTQKYRLLELIAISGESPVQDLSRLFDNPAYTEKMISELKAESLIRIHYKDHLRGCRLTHRAKKMLLADNYPRFYQYLTGTAETNRIKSEPARRVRLHHKGQIYRMFLHVGIPIFPDEKPPLFPASPGCPDITMDDLPLFYTAREVKGEYPASSKIKNSRSTGILLAPHCVYSVYNTGNAPMKWEYRTEVRLNAYLQQSLQGKPYRSRPLIRSLIVGNSIDTAQRFLAGETRKDGTFRPDASFEHFHFLPDSAEGETQLRLLYDPGTMLQLDQLLLSDQKETDESLPIEHDAVTPEGRPLLLAYDFDIQRINRFHTGLAVYGRQGELICFDFQAPVLRKCLSPEVHISSIDLASFRKEFYEQ